MHVPFCRHACWYCGCNRITTQLGSKVVAPYLDTLARELELVSAALPARRRLAQLHWGGGTPNYLNAAEQRQLWELISAHFDLEPQLEASIEVNPEFLSRDQALVDDHDLVGRAAELGQEFRWRDIVECACRSIPG